MYSRGETQGIKKISDLSSIPQIINQPNLGRDEETKKGTIKVSPLLKTPTITGVFVDVYMETPMDTSEDINQFVQSQLASDPLQVKAVLQSCCPGRATQQ